MTYDTNKRILYTGVYERVKLTKQQDKLLMCLRSNEMMDIHILALVLNTTEDNIRVIKKRLISRTKGQLKIKTISNAGYRLENEIEINL